MKTSSVETWSRVAETALLSLIFLAPLAAHGRTWDPAALRVALAQATALTLGAAWLLKGLARGRFEAASGTWPALAPALAFAAWTLARFAAAPYKGAALPELALTLSALLVYGVALLELGGARHAARLAFWTASGGALAGAAAAFGLLNEGETLAAFAAAALPAVLSLRLDPEATPTRRVLALSTGAVLALAAGRSGSAGGVCFFVLSCALFAAAVAGILRGPEARRAALAALGFGALAAAAGALARLSLDPSAAALGSASILANARAASGAPGAALLGWLLLAAAACGLRAAWDLRRRGSLAEAGYAAAFTAGFCAWAACAVLGLTPASGPAAWLAWAGAGVAAGMAPLTRARGIVRTMPLPFGQDVRRLMQGPVLMLFLGLIAWPGLWLASDVRYNRAVAETRAGNLDAALADAGRVWPGSAVFPSSLYLRGKVLMAQGKAREALDAYARLDDAAPDFGRSHARKAEAYAALGDWAGSAAERERQAALSPLDVANLAAWAEAARAAGDLPTARRAATRAEVLAPDEEVVRVQVAANALMERKLAAREDAGRRNGRKGTALKLTPKGR